MTVGGADFKTWLDGDLALEYTLGSAPGAGRGAAAPNPDLLPENNPVLRPPVAGKIGLWAKTDAQATSRITRSPRNDRRGSHAAAPLTRERGAFARIEAFNIFNRANVAGRNGVYGNLAKELPASFGRQVQFQVRFRFLIHDRPAGRPRARRCVRE